MRGNRIKATRFPHYTGKEPLLKRGLRKKGAKRVGLILLTYLLLGTPVTVRACFGLSGAGGAAQASIGALGLSAQIDALLRFNGKKLRFVPRYGAQRKRGRKKSAGHLWREALRAAIRGTNLVHLDVRMRLGLGEAHATAQAAGAVRALLLALLASRDEPFSGGVIVAPDFSGPGLLLTARCIFSFTPGDIMFAALGAATKKLRNEGFTWLSIPSRA